MTNIVKVTFIPKKRAPASCKEVSYLVNEVEPGLALSIAKGVFVVENEHCKYYGDGIAAKQRVL